MDTKIRAIVTGATGMVGEGVLIECLQHPQVGELTLSREKLSIGGTAGQLLVIYHAEPGSSAAEKLALLGSLARPSAAPADLPVTRPTVAGSARAPAPRSVLTRLGTEDTFSTSQMEPSASRKVA